MLKNKFLPYILYLGFFLLGFNEIIRKEGFGQYIFMVIIATFFSSVTYLLAVKKYSPIIAWLFSFMGIYLFFYALSLPFKILFPTNSDSQVSSFMQGYTGTDKVMICRNCGCRLRKGMLGGWAPIAANSHCVKVGKKCVAEEQAH